MDKKIFLFLANGFELLEAMAPLDVFRRAGLNITTVSLNENLEVESAQKVLIKADKKIDEVDFSNGDCVILPGGFPGYINLRENVKVVEIVKTYLKNGKIVGAICGAPTVLGVNNLIEDYTFTCHTGVKEEMNSDKYLNQEVVVDRNLITSQGAGTSLRFAFALVEKFLTKEEDLKLKKGMELL